MFNTLLCKPTWFQMYVLYTIWKYTQSAMILVKENFKIQNSYYAYLWTYGPQNGCSALKVNKFQKQIILISFEPKNKWNYFLNSALASKMSQIKKMEAFCYIS